MMDQYFQCSVSKFSPPYMILTVLDKIFDPIRWTS